MAYTHLTNSLLNFANIESTKYIFKDYFSVDIKGIYEMVQNDTDLLYDWYQINDNSTLEQVSQILYNNASFWDILLIINHKNALFDMPYEYDQLVASVETQIQNYITQFRNGNSLSQSTYDAMYNKLLSDSLDNNEQFRVIKIVKPSKINVFIQKCYELGYIT